MRWWLKFRKRRALDRDLQEEIAFHREMRARDEDVPPFGAETQIREEMRDMWTFVWLETAWQDLRYAVRGIRRSPGFAALAVLIMALGIGANTAVFSVVNTVLLKPLAYRDPDRIVTLTNALTTGEALTALPKQVSIPDFQDWHDQSSSFSAMAYYKTNEAAVVVGSTAEYAQVTSVSPEFLRVLATEPIVGRFFTAEEMKSGGGGAVMITYAYWQSHFGGDPQALGQRVRVYGLRAVAGVLPPGFRFPDQTDLWIPAIGPEPRFAQNYLAAGRLKPGVGLAQAQAEMTSIASHLAQQYPETNKGRSVAVTRMRDEMVGDVRVTLYLLLGAVSVVLLIACANTATLLLGKATARSREVAVRVAIGASRQRIVRQLITESLLLSFVAGASGLLLAYWGSKVLTALAPANLPRLGETGVDQWVLAFTLGISMITSLLFGLVPAIYASKIDLNDALKQGGTRSVIGGGMLRMRSALVVTEIALAVMLLSGAGLLIKSFVTLNNVALGFRPENVLVIKATVPAAPTKARQFFNDVLSQIVAVPGVLAAGATMALPGHVGSMAPYYFDHMPARHEPGDPDAVISIVAPGTFAALGIPLKSGRDFNDGDALDKPFVAVVNEALVRKSLPGQNPIGRTIFCPFDSMQSHTIIGIAGDVRERGPAREPIPECYITYRQHAFNGNTLSVVARTAGDPTALEATLRRLAHDSSPDVPVKFTTMERDASENVAAPRFRTLLFAVFAGLAVCLGMSGVYGVMAYAVGQRANEIGVRIALGASTGDVFRLILGQGLTLAGLGLVLGLAAAFIGTRLLTSMLFRVQPNDPVVFLAVAVLLGIVALVASYVPARRAAKIDPLTAIRQE